MSLTPNPIFLSPPHLKTPKIWCTFSIDWGAVSNVDFAVAIDYAKFLTTKDRETLCAEWERLQEENGELRVFQNGRIETVPIDFFDAYILGCLEKMPEGEFCEATQSV